MDQPAPRTQLSRLQDHLKQIIYGGNDGIVTTFAIVAGFAGANAEGVAQIGGLAVLVFGLANLFADAVSMGLGEFLSTRSAHDLYRARRAERIASVEAHTEDEIVSLSATLSAKGLPSSEARTVAKSLAKNPRILAETQMLYQQGIRPPENDHPALNGMVTFLSFVLFGVLPLLPYILRDADERSFALSSLATVIALAALGLLRWLATGERFRVSVLETVGVGLVCAIVAYLVGWLVGG